MRPEFILRIVYEKAADMLALKIAGLGGITTAKKYADLAEEGGLECNIGSYIAQTGILDAASLHVFVSTPSITISEIGRSILFLDENPIKGIVIKDGVARLRELPGLGVSIEEDKMI